MADFSLLLIKELPQWSYLLTSGIQGLGIIVSLLISFLGFKAYKLTKDDKYKYFFYGFLFLGLSFLANLALNIALRLGLAQYLIERRYEGFMTPLFGMYYFFLIGVMLAYVSLAMVYANMKKTPLIWLFYFWTLVIGIYTFHDSILFNMFSALLISFIAVQAYQKFEENTNKTRLAIFLSFFSLFLFHILILVEQTYKVFFIVRYFILLLGLVLLLITFIKINGGKKK